MEQTLQALAGILQKAIPTIFLLIFLHFYLKAVLFKPLEKALKQRESLTKGARDSAGLSLAAADRKTEEYEGKLREARTELYKEQEEQRRQQLADQSNQISSARDRASAAVKTAKGQIAVETAGARASLTESSAALAEEVASVMLDGRAGVAE